MPHLLMLSLPVADIDRAVDFYAGLGLPLDPRGSDAEVAVVRLPGAALLMLVSRRRFGAVVAGPFADPAGAPGGRGCDVGPTRAARGRVRLGPGG